MPYKTTTELNKTQGKEINIPCSTCSGKPAHNVAVSLDVTGEETYPGGFEFNWNAHYQIAQCLGCKAVSFRKVSTNSEDIYHFDDNEIEYVETESIYPSRIAGRKALGDDTRYLPAVVHSMYLETLSALANQSHVLAGIGVRALLELVCKEKSATGKDLFHKIDSLVASNSLTPASAAILHKIRALGNAAAHEVKPHTEKQLGLAMDVIEHLMKETFILPKQIEAEFD